LDQPKSEIGLVLAFVLISPWDEESAHALAQEESQRVASLRPDDKVAADSVICIKQNIHNA
jgi:hypothetical protein